MPRVDGNGQWLVKCKGYEEGNWLKNIFQKRKTPLVNIQFIFPKFDQVPRGNTLIASYFALVLLGLNERNR